MKESSNCRAWAYGIPNCDSFTVPNCWLKFIAGEVIQDKCRIFGLNTERPCQQKSLWTDKVDPLNVLQEYPRPQMTRGSNFSILNFNKNELS